VGQFQPSLHGGGSIQRARALVGEAAAALPIDDHGDMIDMDLMHRCEISAPGEQGEFKVRNAARSHLHATSLHRWHRPVHHATIDLPHRHGADTGKAEARR